jgi:NADH-quinone oxidoreductase subunit J
MISFADSIQWILGAMVVLSSLGIILLRQPVHACLSFLLTLLTLSVLYLQLFAQFIAVMQILIYAGAILVIFMFVIILFQDAHAQISRYKSKSWPVFLFIAASSFLLTLLFLGGRFAGLTSSQRPLPEGYGTVQSLGEKLYIDFFFPFEAVILLFLVALIGAVYIAKKES